MRLGFRKIAFSMNFGYLITDMTGNKFQLKPAVNYVEDGMTVGLGSGSTVYWAIQKIGERVKAGLKIRAVPSSAATEKQARELGIPLVGFEEIQEFDLDIDGADEVDAGRNLIKGGGGALLREKILAYNSRIFIVIIDESKFSAQLGRAKLPVEVIPFGHEIIVKKNGNAGFGSSNSGKEGKRLSQKTAT
jgi:ribose 5-phosphate isomerase A